MSVDPGRARLVAVSDRPSPRSAAVLLLAGQLLYILITLFHAGGEANDHSVIFGTYAGSGSWKAVHAGQFLAMAVLVAGLLLLFSALDLPRGRAAWAVRLGEVLATLALTLYAVLQAVDGVGNKEVDKAWVNAPEAQEAARFASAEAMRWLEWGARSYHDYALGLALLLLAVAAAAVRIERFPRPAVLLVGVSGVVYLVQGWVVGAEGFSDTHTRLILVAWVVSLVWMAWLAVAARTPRQDGSGAPGSGRTMPAGR